MTRKSKTEARKNRKLEELNQQDVQVMEHKELGQIKGAGGGLMQLKTKFYMTGNNDW